MISWRNLIGLFPLGRNKKVIRFKRSRNPELFDEVQKRMKENPQFLNNLIHNEYERQHQKKVIDSYIEEKNYFWDEHDFKSWFEEMEKTRKEDWDEELEGEEFIPEPETHRFIYFIQDVKTGKCLTGNVDGFGSYEECYDHFEFVEKISDNNI